MLANEIGLDAGLLFALLYKRFKDRHTAWNSTRNGIVQISRPPEVNMIGIPWPELRGFGVSHVGFVSARFGTQTRIDLSPPS